MECTQRLECTQDEYEPSAERTCSEQIGFLGICGSKHPVKKGPNKIGRDPQTCSIVLNDNSISRQHAVINILNKRDFMLMDLDSSNKTKLLDKFLQPYIPQPLKNGDTVQFGQVFGIFRLLEENDDLPMTQAVEIPDTPVNIRHVSRLKTAPIMTIPESPDVSDRDDSVIGQSQPQKKTNFKSPNNNFIKSSGKNMGKQQVGTNKIDNVYWNSSKKSDSFGSKFESNNKSSVSPKKLSVETSIYDMETQPPTSDSIYEAVTQIPSICVSPTIYSCETQVPNIEKLPEAFKIRHQSNVQLNLFSTNENFNIFDAETQVSLQDKDKRVSPILSCAAVINKEKRDEVCSINKKLNSSDEEICFEDIDCPQLEDECGSQPLLPSDPGDIEMLPPVTNTEKIMDIENVKTVSDVAINDSASKDCEEIPPSQVVDEKPMDNLDVRDCDCEDNMTVLMGNRAKKIQSDEDVTDCEDDLNNVNVNNNQNMANDSDLTDCEDDLIEISQNRSKASNSVKAFEDLPTQVISEDFTNHDKVTKCETDKDNVLFEDMLTQVIEECPVNASEGKDTAKTLPFEDLETQLIDIVISQKQTSSTLTDTNSFKLPLPSPRFKKKDTVPLKKIKSTTFVKGTLQDSVEENENYYDATQQIINDLCSQSDQLDGISSYKIENNNKERPSENSDSNKRTNSIVSNMSKEQIREVIGADEYQHTQRQPSMSDKKCSDGSDLEVTPKKFNPSKFLMIDLPSSQEIISCDFVSSKLDATDSSDGFEETEVQDNKKDTHVGFHRKRRKNDVRQDLLKKFDIDTLPTRVITRIRKPTSKTLDSDDTTKKKTAKILESKLGLDKELEIDAEVLQLNLKRLRSKMEKQKNKTSSTKSMKDENDAHLKQGNEMNSKTPKDHKLLMSNEKVLKQQNIRSMFKEPSSKDVKTMEACGDLKTESMDSTLNSRRSTRNNNKGNKIQQIINQMKEVNSESSERKKPISRKHSSQKHVKETNNKLAEGQETVIRRSKRQQATKDKKEDKKEKSENHQEKKECNRSESKHTATSKSTRSNASSNTEHSKVYNLSSEAAVDSPANLKRPATIDLGTSNSKKAKSCNAGSASLRPASARGNRTQYVLFTAFPCEEVKLKLEKLGAVIVSDVKSCTVVLTIQIRRTFKLLCALGLGRPIVGPNWVQACADSHMIVDPWLYLLKDEVTERRFGFNLRQSLTCKRNFLKGYNVFCTPNVSPSAQEMKSIVECSGGTWREGGSSWFCVSCPVDRALWPGLRKRGATLVSTEFILGGVLQQRINLDRDRLG